MFTATNISKRNLETSPLTTNFNRLVIEAPSGKKKEIYSLLYLPKPDILEPTKAQMEKIKIVDLLDVEGFTELGTYRLYWKWLERKKRDKGFNEYLSNEVFLVKEK